MAELLLTEDETASTASHKIAAALDADLPTHLPHSALTAWRTIQTWNRVTQFRPQKLQDSAAAELADHLIMLEDPAHLEGYTLPIRVPGLWERLRDTELKEAVRIPYPHQTHLALSLGDKLSVVGNCWLPADCR